MANLRQLQPNDRKCDSSVEVGDKREWMGWILWGSDFNGRSRNTLCINTTELTKTNRQTNLFIITFLFIKHIKIYINTYIHISKYFHFRVTKNECTSSPLLIKRHSLIRYSDLTSCILYLFNIFCWRCCTKYGMRMVVSCTVLNRWGWNRQKEILTEKCLNYYNGNTRKYTSCVWKLAT